MTSEVKTKVTCFLEVCLICASVGSITESFRLIGMQLREKYKENFDGFERRPFKLVALLVAKY